MPKHNDKDGDNQNKFRASVRHGRRSEAERIADESFNAPIAPDYETWARNIDRFDWPGVDTIPEKREADQTGGASDIQSGSRISTYDFINELNDIETVRAGPAPAKGGGAVDDRVRVVAPVTNEEALTAIDNEASMFTFEKQRQGEKDGELFMDFDFDERMDDVLDF
jgi:hypothetical protein